MKQQTTSSRLALYFVLFVLSNILIYLSIFFFHNVFPFYLDHYASMHIYRDDPRAEGGEFDFLRSLVKYDAQWYLKLAEDGYPKNPTNLEMNDKKVLDGLGYTFFPLYPLVLNTVNRVFNNIELTAFLVSNIFLMLNFFSLFYVLRNFVSESLAAKTIFLLFLFPFSIFYRLFYTEGLYLFLLIWFCYFLIKHRMLAASASLALLNVARLNGIFLNLLFFYYVWKLFKQKKLSISKIALTVCILAFPLMVWFGYQYVQTGDPFYNSYSGSFWFVRDLLWPFRNLTTIFLFPLLPVHLGGSSKLELMVFLLLTIILFWSRKKLHPVLWWTSVFLWITPLLVKDFSSYARYQAISFPMFLYLSMILKAHYYWLVLGLFSIGHVIALLLFVNALWIG